ncbi:MAG: flagellar basal body P-ring protein FlgI [Desulfobacterales bacterium]
MSGRFRTIALLIVCVLLFSATSSPAARIKDISTFKGVRSNQLFGYGLVLGLNGTGDKGGTKFTIIGLVNMLEKMGIHVSAQDVKVNNVAAVIVSATLPPFARTGKKIDVTLSSIGDAKSLQGGTLLLTPLKAVDDKIYALAQGPLIVGGYVAGGSAGGGITKNHPTVARISGGATVEREIPLTLKGKKEFTLVLNNPDFRTAVRIAEVIDVRFGDHLAMPLDPGTLQIKVPDRYRHTVVSLLADLGDLEVVPDAVARVIVNEKTGTVVIGENVRISKVAVAHGNLSIQIDEKQEVSQPQPFGTARSAEGATPVRMEGGAIVAPGGATIVTPESTVQIEEEKNSLILLSGGRSVGDLVRALNAIGVTPRDLITILQTLKAAGALQAQLDII